MTANLTLTYGSLNLTATPYLVEFGLDVGAPQNEANPLAFLLQDGEIELSSRASNRTFTFNVLIEGASLSALATAEAALVTETEKVLNTLTVDSGDGSPATVFDIYRGQVSLVRDDNWELNRMRRYTVTVRALPFGRSVTEVVATALAATGTTTTLVNDGSATTNWTGSVNGSSTAPSVVSGAVGIATSALSDAVTISLTLTTAITTSSTKYIVVDWKAATAGTLLTLRAYGDGVELDRVAQASSPTSGYTRTWFYATASSIAALRLDSYTNLPPIVVPGTTTAVRTFYVDNINRTDIKPTLGTGRELLRSIAISGSARTQGAIAIEHATSSLGDVLAYFFPDVDTEGNQVAGYSPPLKPYRTSAGTLTTDASTVSGSTEDIATTAARFDIPVAALPPGMYLLMVRLKAGSSVSTTVSWSAALNNPAGTAIGTQLSGSKSQALTTTYGIYPLARMTLPPVDVNRAASAAVVRLTLSSTPVITATLDEAWLFNTTLGQLIQVGAGTGTPAAAGPWNRVFVDPATTARPRPTVRVGFAADRSDAVYPSSISAWQNPQFAPSRVNVLTVTTNALDASVTLRYLPRWHTNAAS